MVDIVDITFTVFEVDEVANNLQNILFGKSLTINRHLEAELVVQLQPADCGEIIALGIEEQIAE